MRVALHFWCARADSSSHSVPDPDASVKLIMKRTWQVITSDLVRGGLDVGRLSPWRFVAMIVLTGGQLVEDVGQPRPGGQGVGHETPGVVCPGI